MSKLLINNDERIFEKLMEIEFLTNKFFGVSTDPELYTAKGVGNEEKTLEQRTSILGGYCFFETSESELA